VIGCEDRLQNDLYCVEWGVKLYSNQPTNRVAAPRAHVEQSAVAELSTGWVDPRVGLSPLQ